MSSFPSIFAYVEFFVSVWLALITYLGPDFKILPTPKQVLLHSSLSTAEIHDYTPDTANIILG